MGDVAAFQNAGTPGNLFAQELTIAANKSATEIFSTQGKAIVGLIMPSGWDAAALQWYAGISQSSNTANLKAVYDASSSTKMQTTVAADAWIAFPLPDAIFAPYVQLVSVTAGSLTPVNQTAERKIIVILRNFLD